MRLKSKLKNFLTDTAPKSAAKQDFSESQQLRAQIKDWMQLPLRDFCRQKPAFDMRHGLAAKLLKTSFDRLQNGVLVSHDMHYWLRQNKPVPALWVLRLAGKKGQIARNQYLKWAEENLGKPSTLAVYNWTKKWGIPGDEYSKMTTLGAASVQQARELYKQRDTDTRSRQILGNTLLKQVALSGDPDEVFAFYKSLNKDVQTFQIMFGAMVKNKPLKKYWKEVWETAKRQDGANNIKIDEKLRQTAEIASHGTRSHSDGT